MVCPVPRGPGERMAERNPVMIGKKVRGREGKCSQGTPSKGLTRETLPLSGASKGLDKFG